MKVWCQDSLQRGYIAKIAGEVNSDLMIIEDLQTFVQFTLIYKEVTGKKISGMTFREVAYEINKPKYTLDDIGSTGVNTLNIFTKEKLSESEVEICEVWYKAFR